MGSWDTADDGVPTTSGKDLVSVAVQWYGSTALVTVSGEVDVLSAPRLEEAVANALAEGPARLVIDLTDVGFLASAGLAVLAGTQQRTAEHVDFRVVADGSATSRPMRLTGLDQGFAVYPTREEALTSDV